MPRRSHLRVLVPSVMLAVTACAPGNSGVTSSVTTVTTLAPATSTMSSVDAAGGPSVTTDGCRFDVPPGRLVRCGWLEVPADRSDPAGGHIRLHVAVFESPSLDPAPDPVVFLQGGPGGFALDNLPMTFETIYGHLLVDRDVILFDQRGVGYSEPSLVCPEMHDLRTETVGMELSDDESLRLQMVAIEACRDRLVASGVDLAAYTSAASAADLADLRVALGIEEWNLYGISYGTRLALTVMRDHPEGLRSVVLDSVYPPDVDLIAETPGSLDRSLQTLFDSCAADDACAAAYPDLEATFYAVLEELEEHPIRAPVLDPAAGETHEPLFDGTVFGGLVFGALYHAAMIPELPRMITDVADGDTFLLSVIATSLLPGSAFVSAGMQFSVQCSEEIPFTSRATVDAALARHPELKVVFQQSTNLGAGLFDVCDLWGTRPPHAIEDEAVESGIPALVLAGEFDPITPPSWGEHAAETLAAATFVEIPSAGHGPSATLECAQTMLRSFLAAPGDEPVTECLGDIEPPEFITPGHLAAGIALDPFTHAMRGVRLSGVAPATWIWQGAGTWTRSISALDQTAIIQQPVPDTTAEEAIETVATRFGLDTEPTGAHETALGAWTLYEGSLMGGPVTVAVLEIDGGCLLVTLIAAPGEAERLQTEVMFPALDALAEG